MGTVVLTLDDVGRGGRVGLVAEFDPPLPAQITDEAVAAMTGAAQIGAALVLHAYKLAGDAPIRVAGPHTQEP